MSSEFCASENGQCSSLLVQMSILAWQRSPVSAFGHPDEINLRLRALLRLYDCIVTNNFICQIVYVRTYTHSSGTSGIKFLRVISMSNNLLGHETHMGEEYTSNSRIVSLVQL